MNIVGQKDNRFLYIHFKLKCQMSDLQLFLSTKKDLLSIAQYILALEKYNISSKPQRTIYDIIVSLQEISGPGSDQNSLIDLLIYFAASPTGPYKVAGYNHFLAEAVFQLDFYHRKKFS